MSKVYRSWRFALSPNESRMWRAGFVCCARAGVRILIRRGREQAADVVDNVVVEAPVGGQFEGSVRVPRDRKVLDAKHAMESRDALLGIQTDHIDVFAPVFLHYGCWPVCSGKPCDAPVIVLV